MIISLDKYKATGGGGEKPTEVLTQTITQNGSQTFEPKEGYVFSSAEITTDIHPTETLITTINENGSNSFDGEYNGADITTDIHPTEALITTISENGSHSFSGEYNGADITTDIHPTEALITTINENGSHSFSGEYNGAEITVDVATVTPTGNVDITANGIYDVTNYATANVNVQPSDNYSYFDGVVDVEGLKAIGWDDASIGMFRDNERHYAWQNSDYIVSEENKALNGVIVDKNSISSNRDNPNFKYCPYFDTSKASNIAAMFYKCQYLTSIPQLDTSKFNSLGQTFYGCYSLTSIPQLDTSNVKSMFEAFYGCRSLTSIPQLDTSNVTSMEEMFQNCSSLTYIPQLDTSNVTTMKYMFSMCRSLRSIPQLDTSNVTTMQSIFMMTSYEDILNLTYLGGFKNLSISVTSNFLEKCPNLTVESLMNVINNLATVSGQTLKFGSTNLKKLTAEQIAVATAKGWTLT